MMGTAHNITQMFSVACDRSSIRDYQSGEQQIQQGTAKKNLQMI
ncbi:MAG: hypothetical protein RMY34_34550 [Aulosira sp. DedQUE10]|nr:hypothetical protein [Aulosira sp. DedQUE10]